MEFAWSFCLEVQFVNEYNKQISYQACNCNYAEYTSALNLERYGTTNCAQVKNKHLVLPNDTGNMKILWQFWHRNNENNAEIWSVNNICHIYFS